MVAQVTVPHAQLLVGPTAIDAKHWRGWTPSSVQYKEADYAIVAHQPHNDWWRCHLDQEVGIRLFRDEEYVDYDGILLARRACIAANRKRSLWMETNREGGFTIIRSSESDPSSDWCCPSSPPLLTGSPCSSQASRASRLQWLPRAEAVGRSGLWTRGSPRTTGTMRTHCRSSAGLRGRRCEQDDAEPVNDRTAFCWFPRRAWRRCPQPAVLEPQAVAQSEAMFVSATGGLSGGG